MWPGWECGLVGGVSLGVSFELAKSHERPSPLSLSAAYRWGLKFSVTTLLAFHRDESSETVSKPTIQCSLL